MNSYDSEVCTPLVNTKKGLQSSEEVFFSNSTSFKIESAKVASSTAEIKMLKYEKRKIQKINEMLKEQNSGQNHHADLFEEFINHLTGEN